MFRVTVIGLDLEVQRKGNAPSASIRGCGKIGVSGSDRAEFRQQRLDGCKAETVDPVDIEESTIGRAHPALRIARRLFENRANLLVAAVIQRADRPDTGAVGRYRCAMIPTAIGEGKEVVARANIMIGAGIVETGAF